MDALREPEEGRLGVGVCVGGPRMTNADGVTSAMQTRRGPGQRCRQAVGRLEQEQRQNEACRAQQTQRSSGRPWRGVEPCSGSGG